MSAYFDNKDLFLSPKVSQHGNHMVMTNVYKETKRKYWNIDTRFRDDYDNYSQLVSGSQIPGYTFTLPQTINDVKMIQVKNIEVPMTFYNISAALGNNVLTIDNKLVTILDGFYSAASLKLAMVSALSVASVSGVSFDISYNGNPHSFFQNTSGSPITIGFAVKPSNSCGGVTNPAVGGLSTGDFDKYNFKSKLGWLLGFRNISYTVASGTAQLSEGLLDLTIPRYLYLVVDEFTNSNTNSFISPLPSSVINRNILAKITIDYKHYPFGTILTANPTNGLLISDKRRYNGKVNIQKLKIQLVNEYGLPIHLNGSDFSFCLEIEYE
jgi:hypothetical protein